MDLFYKRKSVRKYKPLPVTDEQVQSILAAACLAPSGNNNQPWKFIVIRNEEHKAGIAAVDHDQQWMLTAPVFIAVLGDITCRLKDGYGPVDETNPTVELKKVIRDSAIAATYLMLEAENLGLSTCWTGWYTQAEMKKALGIDDRYYVVGVFTLGYADEEPEARPRKELSELVSYD